MKPFNDKFRRNNSGWQRKNGDGAGWWLFPNLRRERKRRRRSDSLVFRRRWVWSVVFRWFWVRWQAGGDCGSTGKGIGTGPSWRRHFRHVTVPGGAVLVTVSPKKMTAARLIKKQRRYPWGFAENGTGKRTARNELVHLRRSMEKDIFPGEI